MYWLLNRIKGNVLRFNSWKTIKMIDCISPYIHARNPVFTLDLHFGTLFSP